MRRALLIALPLALMACKEQPADPDLSGEAQIDAETKTLNEAADEAARIVEEDAAGNVAERRANTAAAAAAAGALYGGQAAQPDGTGRRNRDAGATPSPERLY